MLHHTFAIGCTVGGLLLAVPGAKAQEGPRSTAPAVYPAAAVSGRIVSIDVAKGEMMVRGMATDGGRSPVVPGRRTAADPDPRPNGDRPDDNPGLGDRGTGIRAAREVSPADRPPRGVDERVFRVGIDRRVQVNIDGKPASPADLKSGLWVRVMAYGAANVRAEAARRPTDLPARDAGRRTPEATPAPTDRAAALAGFELRAGRIDAFTRVPDAAPGKPTTPTENRRKSGPLGER